MVREVATDSVNIVAPRFSVIVPTCNRAGPLASCLRALEALEYARDGFEVIVVDDASAEPVPERTTQENGGLQVRWIRLNENRGPAAARNEGAAQARGRYLAFLDDDCLPDRSWLAELDHALEAVPGSAVGGRMVNGRSRNVYAAVNQALLDEVYRYYNQVAAEARFFATMNLAVPADGFREAGGFDPSFRASEDREFCARWLDRGLPLVYAPEAVVVHDAAPGCREFWSRHYHFGEGSYHFRRRHTTSGSGRVRLEPAGFYGRLVMSPLRGTSGWRAVLAPGLACLSQIASGLGFWAARRRYRRSR
jgi:GT2 family glycosyltransferase